MVTALLTLLNQSINLTPDQIAARLNSKGWVRGKDMTQNLLDSWGHQLIRVATAYGNVMNEDYNADSFGLTGYRGSLYSYWFILKENYHESNPPPKPDGQADA